MHAALEWLESLQGSGIRPGLVRMRAMLKALGNPHQSYESIIVAGTNGKGSTTMMLASILDKAGYRIGVYTSPHLVDLRERWLIGREPVPERDLVEAIETLQVASQKVDITPTYFEALTLLAFILFQRAGCDLAVLEVGMGGRLDATNVVKPLASIITPIGFDHTEYLGNTLRKIAFEKAGVIHRGAIVLTSNHDPDVVDVLRRRAEKFGNEFHEVRPDGTERPPLAGDFQRDNTALAIRAASLLAGRLPKITAAAIDRGIAATRWRGRLERADVGGKVVWVDGCHNAHGARAVAPLIPANLDRPRLLVFGIMADKNVDAVASILFPMFDRIITTEPYRPRSASASALLKKAHDMGIDGEAHVEPRHAFEAALSSDVRTVFVGGSLYLAGAAIEFLDEMQKR